MNVKKSVTLAAVAVAIAAGGNSREARAGIDAGGAPQTQPGVAKGAVTGFGSIYVNGVRYNTDEAIFVIDGVIGAESDLTVGQVVSVQGSIDENGTDGTARIVFYDDAVEGPISSIAAADRRMTVLGQTVLINNDTTFGNVASLQQLGPDDIVEVSGYADADGNIVASYVSASDAVDDFDVTGVITAVDTSSAIFKIGELRVDYSGADLFDLTSTGPQTGQKVEVLGKGFNAAGDFDADYVWTTVGLGIDAGGRPQAEVQGLVTKRNSLVDFEIDGVPVRMEWFTTFRHGSVFELSPSSKVEVEGRLGSDGVLVADVIEYVQSAEMSETGFVEAVVGELLVVDGNVIAVTAEMAYVDGSEAGERRFNIEDVASGDFVEVRGYTSDAGYVVATRLERNDAVESDDAEDEDNDHE